MKAFSQIEAFSQINTPTGRYYTNGKCKYPSITSILSIQNAKNPYLKAWKQRVGEVESKRIMLESTQIGSFMHKCFENLLNGSEIPIPINEYEKTGLLMFNVGRKRIESIVKDVIIQEQAVYSHTLKVAGSLDLLFRHNNGKLVLLDFKSSKKPKRKSTCGTYKHQIAYYYCCLKEMLGNGVDECSLFVINKQGFFTEIVFSKEEMECPNLYNELVDFRMEFYREKGF